jgi:tetratricopeptide (TPR) repeat protein
MGGPLTGPPTQIECRVRPSIPDDDPAVLERQAQQALARRRIDEARSLADSLRRRCPERISGWIFGAQAEQMAGDLPRMLDLALEGRARAPHRADMAFVACDALRITGAVAEARRVLAETEVRLPEAVAPWALLSAKLAEIGEIAGSLRAAQRVERMPGGRAQGLALAAGALTALGRMEEAEQRLCTLIQENPGEVDAYYQRAVLRRARRGDVSSGADAAKARARTGWVACQRATPLRAGQDARRSRRTRCGVRSLRSRRESPPLPHELPCGGR